MAQLIERHQKICWGACDAYLHRRTQLSDLFGGWRMEDGGWKKTVGLEEIKIKKKIEPTLKKMCNPFYDILCEQPLTKQ